MTTAALRLRSQLLSGRPARDPLAVAERLLAIQAQDPRGARLAIRARCRTARASDVDRALTEERSLVVTWLCRGTLHLVRTEDYPWLQALTTPALFTAVHRRLEQEGLDAPAVRRGQRAIERGLGADGPLTRHELRERVASAGVPTAGQALVHQLFLACLRGVAVRGPMIGREHAYALVEDWLGPRPAVERIRALAELARRFLAGHTLAEDRDLAKWAGLPLRDARAGLEAIAGELTEHGGLLALRGAPRTAPPAPPRLLGAFDPVLHGWRSREFVLGDRASAVIAGGMFHPFALVGGRAAARWGIRSSRAWIEPFAVLDPVARVALEADGEDAVRYLAA